LEDLAAQLAEFELRCAGEDYKTAAAVALEIDYDYLHLWGHYRLVTELYERLQGHIADPALRQYSVGNLGAAYRIMAQYQRTIPLFEQALTLARERKDHEGEGACLGDLGNCYAELGETNQAIGYYEQALVISREVGNRHNEAVQLANLGNRYLGIGQIVLCIEYYKQALVIDRELGRRVNEANILCNLGIAYIHLGQTAEAMQCLNDTLAIAREIGYRLVEAATQTNIGIVYLDQGAWGEAAQVFKQAIEIADDTAHTQFQLWARLGMAEAHLYQRQLAAARAMAEAAQQYNYPLDNHRVSAVLGVAALRQGDRLAAQAAFAKALTQARDLLTHSPQLYTALYTQGLALCGLALCENVAHMPGAKEAYKAARALTTDAGVVGRVLLLFDALAEADTVGLLAEVRAEAAGEQPQ